MPPGPRLPLFPKFGHINSTRPADAAVLCECPQFADNFPEYKAAAQELRGNISRLLDQASQVCVGCVGCVGVCVVCHPPRTATARQQLRPRYTAATHTPRCVYAAGGWVGVVDNMQEWQCVLLTHVCMGGATQVLLLPKHRAAQAAAAASTAAARQDAADPATAVDDQFESAQQVLEDCLERLDTALDAAQQQLQEYKDEGIARPGVMTISGPLASWRLTGSGVKGAACVLDNAAAGRGRVGLPQAAAGAGSRPQDRFATPVDNSNAPWWPNFKHLAGRVTGPPAAGEAAAHPYREELQQLRCVLRGSRGARGRYRACCVWTATCKHTWCCWPLLLLLRLLLALLTLCMPSLRYQGWQLEAGTPQPPPDLAASPVTWVDTPESLAAMVASLGGCREVALDLEHHSYHSFQGFTCLLQVGGARHQQQQEQCVGVGERCVLVGPGAACSF